MQRWHDASGGDGETDEAALRKAIAEERDRAQVSDNDPYAFPPDILIALVLLQRLLLSVTGRPATVIIVCVCMYMLWTGGFSIFMIDR
jgi:hypothetical protein